MSKLLTEELLEKALSFEQVLSFKEALDQDLLVESRSIGARLGSFLEFFEILIDN